GSATPAPPVGTSLGKYGVNLGQFVSQFNDRTKEFKGTPIPVVVTVYSDRTFEFITKSPPAASMLKMAAGIAKGSGVPNKTKVGKVTRAQIDEICNKKMADLNARDLEHARSMIEGTARSMGIEVEG
ncbi:MAG: 50S ribosomal protein L11, partial [Pirellulaceae bacterium]